MNYPWILFIHGFATGMLSTWLGLLLVNIRPALRKLVFIGLIYAIMNTVIRNFDIGMGIQFTVLTVLLVIVITLNWNLNVIKSTLVVLLGTVVMALGETLSMYIILRLTGITLTYEQLHPLINVIMPVPQIIMTLIIIHLCLKYRRYIFDFSNADYLIPNERRVRVIVVLATTMLLLLLIQIIFNLYFNLSSRYIITHVSIRSLILFPTIAMISAFLIMILIIQQLFVLLGKESKYITQSAYVQTLDELYTATRAESHDRINHMQTLYGFVQLGNLEETREYLEELIGEIVVSRNYLATGHPALSALFYIKTGLATSRGIQLDILTETRVENLAIPPHELNRILGNLINNAFDSVATLPKENRKVSIEIAKLDKKYRFSIRNCGKLDLEAIKHIFDRGYSTKKGEHQGLGLFIVRQLVEKHRGQVEVDNQDGIVTFTVYLPESTLRSETDEWVVTDSGEYSSGKLEP